VPGGGRSAEAADYELEKEERRFIIERRGLWSSDVLGAIVVLV